MLKLIVVALAPAIIIMMFFYIKDEYDKEPLKLLLKAVMYGFIATGIACVLECAINSFIKTEEDVRGFMPILLYYLFAVGLVEEGAKFWFLVRKFYPHREFNEVYDGIIYGAFISLGFAALENVIYVLSYGMKTGILRAFTAVPGHAIDGSIAGYYVGLAKFTSSGLRRKTLLLTGFSYSVLLHGFYDASIAWNYGFLTAMLMYGILIFGGKTVLNQMKKSKRQIQG